MSKFVNLLMSQVPAAESEISQLTLLASLLFTMAVAGLMALTYRLSHSSLTYNRKFNITLIMLALISTVLLTLIQKNPLFSLGVLGSLSICRIRLNTKDPRDLGFVFWAMAIGIASSVGAYFAGLITSLILCVVLVVSSKMMGKTNSSMVVVRGEKPQIEAVQQVFGGMRGISVQSKNIFAETFELVYEIHVKPKEEERLISRLNEIEGIHGVNVLAPETKAA